jgi:tetratricopeptide (TPR) repeat protein
MKRMRRLGWTVVVLTLPLLLSQCANREATLTESDLLSAKIGMAQGSWKKSKGLFGADKQKLPADRVEALGEIALQNRDYESSLVNFMAILQKNPERYDLHYKVGVIFLLNGQLEAAQKELALVLVHQPEMTQAHEAMGLVHLQEKKYPLAIEEFQLVLSQDPHMANARHLLGVTYLEMRQPAKAVAQLKQAVALNPSNVASYAALGEAYLELKDSRQAIATLKRGLAIDPKNQRLNFHLGKALAAENRYDEALDTFMKVGDEAQAYNNIGVHYFMAGQYEDAAKCFQRAIELRPTFYDEAKTNLQRALEKLHQMRKNDG